MSKFPERTSVRTKVRKAVLLAGGGEERFAPLTKQRPVCMLPVMNEPLIEHNIEFLYQKGLKDIIITFSKESAGALESIKERNREKINIHLYRESVPRGTAGILADVAELLENEPFLVMNSSLYMEDADLEELINFHENKRSAVTVGVKRCTEEIYDMYAIRASVEGAIEEVVVIHPSTNRNLPWVFSGIYMFTPAVFDFIDPQKYLDIKEQLIPLLKNASLPVYAHEIKGYYRDVNSIENYFALHRDLFAMKSRAIYFNDKKEISEEVWVGKEVTISPEAYLMGPVVLGNKCCIASRAQIIGPAAIGDGCNIAEDSIVRESILWRNVSLEKMSRSEYSIMGEGVRIPEGKRLRNLVVVDNLSRGDMNLMPQGYKITGIGVHDLPEALITTLNNWILNFIKRVMDISIAAALLLILSPLYILIALAIKIDSKSPGPIFFIQKRCGRNGKMFEMFKFRTMIASAEKIHDELLSQKDIDGPMFKMVNDPRVTRVGRILRKTSLDELPQFINVIRGEMSLVGPRPLIMEEMKFSLSWRDVRLRVKPGITGLWQVESRSKAPFYDWIRYDVEYVKNQSLWMDIKILFKTIKVVFKKAGAY